MPRLLFIGDIVGRPGREAIHSVVPRLRHDYAPDFVVANAENSASGAGLTGRLAQELLACGVDALTLGDHVWDQRGFENEIDSLDKVCRPANLPRAQPGRSFIILTSPEGFRLGLFTLLGRVFVGMPSDCPFAAADQMVEDLRPRCDSIFCEIHAEATAEKIALSWHLDGRVALVAGTHTHVPTADARLLPRGTAAITDVGMTGPHASVLGRSVGPVVEKFRDGMPRRFEIAEGDVRLNGVLVDLDPSTGLATRIQRIEAAA